MDSRYRFLTLGTPWTQSMPSRDVNAVTRLAEASWWRDKSKMLIDAETYLIAYIWNCEGNGDIRHNKNIYYILYVVTL